MKQLIRCGGILFAITLIMGALLGFVNHITAPKIAQLAEQTRLQSVQTVLGGEIVGEEITHNPRGETTVTEISEFKSENGSVYAVTAAPKGYGGEISMMVGIDGDGAVTGVSIMDMSETAGLGAKAKDEAFLSQFVGKNPEIKAITGATITSTAVKKGVNDALSQVEMIKEGDAQ